MNILIFTPMYCLDGKRDLVHDSSAIHYLVRPWAKENNVLVVYVYYNSIKCIHRYLKYENRLYKNGYYYEVDSVKVGIIEIQKWPKQKPHLFQYQAKKVMQFTREFAKKNDFYPDIIVSHIPFSTIGAVSELYRDVRKIAVLHNTDKVVWYKYKRERDLEKRCFNSFYVRSKVLLDFFRDEKLQNLKNDIVYSGVPFVNYEKRQRNKDRIDIVYAGKLIQQKNIDITIRALSLIKHRYKFFFHVLGEGKLRKRLELLAKKELQPDTYRFYGRLSRNETMQFFLNMDVFIMASLNETFGLTYLEAMMCGCVPVGSRNEGIDGVIIDGENGFLVEPGNIDQLAEVIETIINMKERDRLHIAQCARNTAQKFNEKDMGDKYYSILSNAIY